MRSSVKFVKKNEATSVGIYYTNLIGRAVTTYNSSETSYLQPSEQMFVFDNLAEIKLDQAHADTVVAVLRSGGAMPHRVGSWLQKKCMIGSLYSISIYEKILY